MPQTLLFAVVGLTSVVAYAWARRRWGLPRSRLGEVAHKVVEWIGMSLVFLLANAAITSIGILAVRSVTPWFQSIYVVDDDALVILSALQGSALQWWRAVAR